MSMQRTEQENGTTNYDRTTEGTRKRTHVLSPPSNKKTKPNESKNLNTSIFDRLSATNGDFKKPNVTRKELNTTKAIPRNTVRQAPHVIKSGSISMNRGPVVQSRVNTSVNSSSFISSNHSFSKSPAVNRVLKSPLVSKSPGLNRIDFKPKWEESEKQKDELIHELSSLKSLIKDQTDLIAQMESKESKSNTTLRQESEDAKSWKSKWESIEIKRKELEEQVERDGSEKVALQKSLDANEKKIAELKIELAALVEEMSKKEVVHKIDIGILKETHGNEMKHQKEEFEGKIHNLKEDHAKTFKEERELRHKEVRVLTNNLDNTKIDLEYSLAGHRQKDEKMADLEKKLVDLTKVKDDLEGQRQKNENERRYLHNQVQELKGNIRVYCRCRPILNKKDGDTSHMQFSTDRNGFECGLDLDGGVVSNATGDKSQLKKYSFQFDRVFKPDAGQGVVFEEISQLVQSALDGFKVCIFAYGQTGSGKTYTMEGPSGGMYSEGRGMIPRSVDKIFNTAEVMGKQGWKYTITASYLEIYNEEINDLLVKKPKQGAKYEIKHDPKGNTCVTDLEYKVVTNSDEVFELLKTASKNRQVAQTKCNDHSSRSHSVFSLQITGKNESNQQVVSGLLNLIDLAGSERLKESGASGSRLKETQNINASLSYLGDVIHALANKEKFVPFRNSQLTYLLQNCLGGDCKTLMFVNIAPNVDTLNETVNSLRFASKVNACQIGTAHKRVTSK